MLTPISVDDLRTLADSAGRLAKTIRTWLPVEGNSEPKTSGQRTGEHWFYLAAEHFVVCERIRNPHKLAFGISSGQYHGPAACSAAWFELSAALDEIAVAYRLQPVSDESGIPHLPVDQAVPAVESGTLRRLEQAAGEITEVVRAVPPTVEKPVEHLEHRKINLPNNPDVAEVWNAIQAAEPGPANVADICRSIAEKRGCNAESLRSMLNRWKRKNIG